MDIKKILFLTPSDLGEIVLTTPVFRKLHSEFPDAVIDVITNFRGKEIFSFHDAVGDVIATSNSRSLKDRMKRFFMLRARKYDAVVDMKKSFMARFLGARNYNVFHKHSAKDVHRVKQYLSCLEGLVKDPYDSCSFYLPMTSMHEKKIAKLLKGKNAITKLAISPSLSGSDRSWDTDKLTSLIGRIRKDMDCHVYLTGNNMSEKMSDGAGISGDENITVLPDRASVPELYGLYKNMDIVVCCNSAHLHIASASGVPTVALLGTADGRVYGPLSEKNVVVRQKKRRSGPGEAESASKGVFSVEDIEVSDVFCAVKTVLDKRKNERS